MVETLGDHPSAAAALTACGVTEAQRPSLREGAGRPRPFPDDRTPGVRRMTAVLPRAPGRRAADRPVRVRPRRPDLPDLGAHLRLQPGVRALPVLLGTAGPARAVHRRGRGGHRRAAADAGLLRQRRRRRADRPAGLLAPARLRHRPRRRRQVLHQRREAGQGARGAAGRHRLRRRADLPGRRDGRGQRRRPRGRLVRHGHPGAGEPGRGRDEGLQGLRRRHPGERRPARRVQGADRPLRRPAADHPAAPLGPRRRRLGPAAPHPGSSSASSTPGCWPTARRCSPATRSSTCRRSARRCPGSTSAAPAGSCA